MLKVDFSWTRWCEWLYNVDNDHDYVLVLIMMMLVELLWWWCWWIIYECVHICRWWILTCYWRRLDGVSMYWNMLMLIFEVCVNICIVVESYVRAFMTDGWRILYPYWRRQILCIQLFGMTMTCCWHHEVTTSELTWYHMYLEESRTMHAFIIWRVVS